MTGSCVFARLSAKQMIVTTEYADIAMPGSPMRTFIAAPKAEGRYPGIWCFSDIFQLTPPMLRTCVRLAGYGFVAAAPEIYRRIESPGTVIPFDDAGRTRGQQDAAKTPVAHFDADCRAGLDWLSKHPKVASGKIGAVGFCIGGLTSLCCCLRQFSEFRSTDSDSSKKPRNGSASFSKVLGNNQWTTRSIHPVPIIRKTARKKSVVSSPRR